MEQSYWAVKKTTLMPVQERSRRNESGEEKGSENGAKQEKKAFWELKSSHFVQRFKI